MFKKRKRRQKKSLFIDSLAVLCFKGMGSYYWAVNHPKYGVSRVGALYLTGKIDKEIVPTKLDWLLTEGFQKRFSSIKKELLQLTENEQDSLIDSLDAETAHKYRVVRRYMNRLNEHGIAAYDISHCIYNNQIFAKSATLLWSNLKHMSLIRKDRDERSQRAAEQAQLLFSNWNEYVTSFIVGVQFRQNSTADSEAFMKTMEPTFTKLLTSKYSPLQNADWNTNLNV
ncbi:hypothetical protein ABID52_000434 [Fictibacillus halophilus]|uniref:DUF1266 domain-containing protein n=1 Tax=Fictibacillus halophilus TaxID=1610490 RepID=A0ABV2LE29_9BACL